MEFATAWRVWIGVLYIHDIFKRSHLFYKSGKENNLKPNTIMIEILQMFYPRFKLLKFLSNIVVFPRQLIFIIVEL